MAQETGITYRPQQADADMFDPSTGELIASCIYNGETEIAISNDSTDIQAGRTNGTVAQIFSNSSITGKVTIKEFSPKWIAMTVGEKIVNGNYAKMSGILTAKATTSNSKVIITLDKAPIDNVIYVKSGDDFITVSTTTASGVTTADVTNYGFVDNDCVTYKMFTSELSEHVNIKSDMTPSCVKLVIYCDVMRNPIGKIGQYQITLPSWQLDGNLTDTFAAGDTSYELNGKALAMDSDVCGEGKHFGSADFFPDTSKLSTVYSEIIATPRINNLKTTDVGQITVYGVKSAFHEKTLITDGLTFTIPESDMSIATVSADGEITAVGAGSTSVTVAYGKLKTQVSITVVVKE